MKQLGITFLFISVLAAGEAPKEKIAIAVNDFRGEGITESSARIITDRIRSELFASGRFMT